MSDLEGARCRAETAMPARRVELHGAKARRSRRNAACGNDTICSDLNELVGGCGRSLPRTGLDNREFSRFSGLKSTEIPHFTRKISRLSTNFPAEITGNFAGRTGTRAARTGSRTRLSGTRADRINYAPRSGAAAGPAILTLPAAAAYNAVPTLHQCELDGAAL